jgi:hypothetical protein
MSSLESLAWHPTRILIPGRVHHGHLFRAIPEEIGEHGFQVIADEQRRVSKRSREGGNWSFQDSDGIMTKLRIHKRASRIHSLGSIKSHALLYPHMDHFVLPQCFARQGPVSDGCMYIYGSPSGKRRDMGVIEYEGHHTTRQEVFQGYQSLYQATKGTVVIREMKTNRDPQGRPVLEEAPEAPGRYDLAGSRLYALRCYRMK